MAWNTQANSMCIELDVWGELFEHTFWNASCAGSNDERLTSYLLFDTIHTH